MCTVQPLIVAPTAASLDLPPPDDEASTIGGGTTCSICFLGVKSHAAVPCGHQFACRACAEAIRANSQPCPMCRREISMFIEVRVC